MTGAIQRNSKLHTGVLVAVAVTLVAVALPALALLSVVGRVLVLVVVLMAGVVVLVSPPLRRTLLFAEPAPDQVYKGLRIAEDVLVHPAHSYARLMPRMRARVGIDDLAQRALGPLDSVALPEPGTTVRQGEPLFTIRREGRAIRVKAPISGRVIAGNEALCEDPNTANDSPYREGWAVELAATDLDADEAHLAKGRGASRWFREEVDRLVAIVTTAEARGQVLADGGVVAPALHQEIDDETWARLEREIFGAEEQ